MGHFKLFDKKSYDLNKDSNRGVLILHGFSSTTYETLPLAEFLSKRGFRAVAPNLPGHGTTVEDCNSKKFQDWLDFVDVKLAELSSECDEVSVVGLSMGAVLSLYLATFFPMNKLIVCATVLKFKNPYVVNLLIPLVNKFLKQRKKPFKKNPHKNWSGYDHYPLTALNEFRKLNQYVSKKLSKVTCPTLYIHSTNDRLSNYENVNFVMDNISAKAKEKLIVKDASHHLFYESKDKNTIFESINSFLKKKN